MARKVCIYVGLAIALAYATALPAIAATSFSNPLTGFTGNSTQPATQAALAAAGFNFASTTGFNDNGTPEPEDDSDDTVVFDSNGANFGTLRAGDSSRNYMRTIESDYANIRFVAEVTLAIPTSDTPPYQSGFLGLGADDIGPFTWPDWNTLNSSVMVVPELFEGNHFFKTMYTSGGAATFSENIEVPGLDNGTHRLRLTYDLFPKSAVFSIDFDQVGDGSISGDELKSKLQEMKQDEAALVEVTCLVTRNNQPLEGAVVNFVPESFMGEAFEPATGVTARDGTTFPTVAEEELSAEYRGRLHGVHCGVYRVEVTHPNVDIPAKYNTQTELGRVVSRRDHEMLTINF